MCPSKKAVWLACGLAALLAGNVGAQDASSGSGIGSALPFQTDFRNGEVIGAHQVQRAFIARGESQFMIVVPGEARAESKMDRITITAVDYSYFITFRVLGGPGSEPASPSPEDSREFLRQRFPGSSLLDQSTASVADKTGVSFDLNWKVSGGMDQLVRVVLVPSPAGLLEFTLITDGKKTTEPMAIFDTLLSTFRTNEKGPIQVVRFTETS